jgi:hypothetical protein
MNRFQIARMHRDPHTNVSVHRESFPQFFRDTQEADATLKSLNAGDDPAFFRPGHPGVYLEIQGHACDGHALHRTA